jgi:hemerythrin-like domain-containing protein
MAAHAAGQQARSLRDFLLGDHARLDELFSELLDEFREGDRDEVRSMWARFEEGLLGHFTAEERYLLPLYDKAEPGEAERLLSEHASFRRTLEELGVGVDLGVVNVDVAKAFVDRLRGHARREDHLLYRWAEREVGAAGRKAVTRDLGGVHDEPEPPESDW